MKTIVNNGSGYPEIPLAMLTESPTNPRRQFNEDFLKGLAATIRNNGVLSPLLVRPMNERFEIVFGAQRFRAAKMAEKETIPAIIREMTDAEVLEAQLVENLQRRDVHPMEEAQGFKALLYLDEPKYSIEQLAAKTGKSPVYVAARLKLTELSAPVVEAFYAEEIGVGHALLLAKLPADKQVEALNECFQEEWKASADRKAKRILLPVRHLQTWIEQNILLLLKDAPFDKRDAHLVAIAGSCVDCPQRTAHNKLLFADLGKQDACTNPSCFSAKVDAHVIKTVAAKPKLVQISTAYNKPQDGSPVLPRSKYVAIREEKPKDKELAQRPEYKTCKFTTEAIIAEGGDKGTIHKVCANPDCPVHHPKQRPQRVADDAKWKAEQEKERREAAIANTTSIRVFEAISEAVPVRLMKRDLFFIAERLVSLMDENRLVAVARQHGIKKAKDHDSIGKLFIPYLRRAEESVLGSVLVQLSLVLAASRQNGANVLREAATLYKVDADAIALKVRQEFAAKDKAKAEKKPPVKTAPAKKNGSGKKAA
jgi:ParB family chromosome partitioning protein